MPDTGAGCNRTFMTANNRLLAAAKLELNDTGHFRFRRWLAGPDFELARALLREHLESADDVQAAGFCQLEQRCVERVVDHVEDERCIQFALRNRECLFVAGY